jgi:hypothetical protein
MVYRDWNVGICWVSQSASTQLNRSDRSSQHSNNYQHFQATVYPHPSCIRCGHHICHRHSHAQVFAVERTYRTIDQPWTGKHKFSILFLVYTNRCQFNKKEHSAICIMCAAAANTPEAMTVLAVQKLYYNIKPSAGVGVFLILSTQMLGYGVAGLLRKTLVHPTNMLYPSNLPTASLLENLHKDRASTKKKMRIFYIAFLALFLWQAFPQYISKCGV